MAQVRFLSLRFAASMSSQSSAHRLYPQQKAPAPHCILTAAYVSGWCEANFKVPMIGVEVECDAVLSEEGSDNHCDFVVAHPNQVEHFVRYYTDHQKQRRDAAETHLELLAKTRSLRNRTRPGMGNWLKKIIDREISLGVPQPNDGSAPIGQFIGSSGAAKKEAESNAGSSGDEESPASIARSGSEVRSLFLLTFDTAPSSFHFVVTKQGIQGLVGAETEANRAGSICEASRRVASGVAAKERQHGGQFGFDWWQRTARLLHG